MKIDTKNTKQSYWEKVLNKFGLGPDQGSQGTAKDRHAIAGYLESYDIQTRDVESLPSGYEIIDPAVGPVKK